MVITVARAVPGDESGIQRVCSHGWRETYTGLYPRDFIERVVDASYTLDRLEQEVRDATPPDGYWVARDAGGHVLGAGGGGLTGQGVGEVFVLYVDPDRLYQGIGTRLLTALTEEQVALGAGEQWASVAKGNEKGLPFYRARGFEVDHERQEEWGTTLCLRRSLDASMEDPFAGKQQPWYER